MNNAITGTLPSELGALTELSKWRKGSTIACWISARVFFWFGMCVFFYRDSEFDEQYNFRKSAFRNGKHEQLRWVGRIVFLLHLQDQSVLMKNLWFCTEELYLAMNDLSGTIPTEFGNLSALSKWDDLPPIQLRSVFNLILPCCYYLSAAMYLYYNNLEGSVPESFCENGVLVFSDSMNSCSCCYIPTWLWWMKLPQELSGDVAKCALCVCVWRLIN